MTRKAPSKSKKNDSSSDDEEDSLDLKKINKNQRDKRKA
jgi:hypothetical protein